MSKSKGNVIDPLELIKFMVLTLLDLLLATFQHKVETYKII